MQLIFLYIGDVGINLRNQGITFGKGFDTKYDAERKYLLWINNMD